MFSQYLSRENTIPSRHSPPNITIFTTRHSHSIVLHHPNALNFQRTFFHCTAEHRPPRQKICALDSAWEFPRVANSPVSATIGVDRSILQLIDTRGGLRVDAKNTVSALDT